ncbi:MAG: inorganic phosphate transporter, partial [Thermoplasmata archaeon]|nr:inorganic phosphate transporter [Thermoplasmata archaeon]
RFIRKAIFDVEDTIGRAKKLIPLFIFLVFFIIIFTGISGGLKNLRDTMEVLPISDNVMDLVLDNMLFKLGLAAAIGMIAAIVGRIRLSRSSRRKGEGKYDMVERLFGSLLILTACYVAFAHGANDVANSIGPVAAIWSAARDGTISSTVEIPPVILILGGAGIVVGISTWGYKVMTTIGKKITRITPTRGFAASFGGATSVLICSFLGIPVSTSQIIVGAVIGVGLAGGITAIDFRVIRNIVTSWVLTIPIAAGTAAALFLLFRGIMLIIL